MGKLNIFEISFANVVGVFYAGTMVQGHVTVELLAEKSIKAIKLNMEGKAKVEWTESETTGTGSNQTTRTVTYDAKEEYFDIDIYLLKADKGDTIALPPGRHTFPFQFQLPNDIPNSFEGGIGHVRYLAKCKIDKPGKDYKTKKPFTVISILDLNQQPNCMQRLQDVKEKYLCCLCCREGPIHASFSIDRHGYVPGEAIRLSAEISNGTSQRMTKSYVDLEMLTVFHATTKSRSEKRQVARVTRPAIEEHSEDVWNAEQLVIPPLPPSFLIGCKIIDIRYILQLNVDPSGPSFDLEIPLEIIIGNIPLASVVQQYPPLAPPLPASGDTWMAASAPSPEAMYPPSPPGGIPDIPPPCYNECITGRVDIRDEDDNEYTRGDMQYAPAYTYYNWGHTPGAMPEQRNKK